MVLRRGDVVSQMAVLQGEVITVLRGDQSGTFTWASPPPGLSFLGPHLSLGLHPQTRWPHMSFCPRLCYVAPDTGALGRRLLGVQRHQRNRACHFSVAPREGLEDPREGSGNGIQRMQHSHPWLEAAAWMRLQLSPWGVSWLRAESAEARPSPGPTHLLSTLEAPVWRLPSLNSDEVCETPHRHIVSDVF